MELLLGLDLDWLCIAAEIAAGLLLLSFAWTPSQEISKDVGGGSGVTVDWESLQSAFVHATTATARSLAVHSNATDEWRLRDLLSNLPVPYRDRLTGVWNAKGMDGLIKAWSLEPNLGVYPSCYVLLELANVDELVEKKGPICIETGIRAMSERLVTELGGCASISHYQPHRFLIHCFGKTSSDCVQLFDAIAVIFSSPDFFSFQDEPISLECERKFWFCNRSVEPEELNRLLEEGEEESSSSQEEALEPEVKVLEPEPVEVKPFSIDDLAPFPCPWDDESEPVPTSIEETQEKLLAALEQAQEVADPEGSTAQISGEGVDSKKVAGLASPEQIEELLSQLNGGLPEGLADQSFSPFSGEPEGVMDGVSTVADLSEFDPCKGVVARDHAREETLINERMSASGIELPQIVAEASKTRSIYTDDLEESLIKDDLTSLFAAVRSSAVGDFGYTGSQSQAKADSGEDDPTQSGGKNSEAEQEGA
jgi:hypothetical protein